MRQRQRWQRSLQTVVVLSRCHLSLLSWQLLRSRLQEWLHCLAGMCRSQG
jgi:hypothetical protein